MGVPASKMITSPGSVVWVDSVAPVLSVFTVPAQPTREKIIENSRKSESNRFISDLLHRDIEIISYCRQIARRKEKSGAVCDGECARNAVLALTKRGKYIIIFYNRVLMRSGENGRE
jgi:hypothetical protein